MDKSEKLARALEFRFEKAYPKAKYNQWLNKQGDPLGIELDAMPICDGWASLEAYFSSPEGQQSIRDQVRELAYRVYYAFNTTTGDKKHCVTAHFGARGHHRIGFEAKTEAEVWESTLLWLVEREATDGQE